MALLLNPRFWIAIALAIGLAFTHFTAYRAGKAVVNNEWTKEKLAQTEAALAAQQENQRIAQAWATKTQEALNATRQREATNRAAADGARAESDRLRDTLAARERDLSSGSASACADYAATVGAVLRDVEEAGRKLAATADGHATDALGCVQAWPR